MDPYAGGEPGNGASGGGGDDHTSMWDWQAGGYYEPTDTSHDLPTFMWDCLNQDDNELLTLLENQTPLRDCGGFHSGLFDLGDITCKETLEESREPKRRRMLEYPPESDQPEVGNHGTSSAWAPSEATEASLLCNDEPQSLNWGVQNNENNLDTVNTFSNGALYQPSHNNLENCCDEASMYLSHDHSNVHSDGQTDVSGTCEIAPVTESAIIQETNKLSTLKVFKGENSSIKVKKNLTTSVAYPFTLIKPSWDQGDVTLKDINQRIHAPPKKAPVVLGTSAFSGKPVIGKTRIRTEGGKGSITILRTKG